MRKRKFWVDVLLNLQIIYMKMLPLQGLHPRIPYFHKQTIKCSSEYLCIHHTTCFRFSQSLLYFCAIIGESAWHTSVWHAQRSTMQLPFASAENQLTKAEAATAWSSNHQQSPCCSCHQSNSAAQALEPEFD